MTVGNSPSELDVYVTNTIAILFANDDEISRVFAVTTSNKTKKKKKLYTHRARGERESTVKKHAVFRPQFDIWANETKISTKEKINLCKNDNVISVSHIRIDLVMGTI